jgi:hypothetical protein
MVRAPVTGDVDAPAAPHPVVSLDVVEDACERGGAPGSSHEPQLRHFWVPAVAASIPQRSTATSAPHRSAISSVSRLERPHSATTTRSPGSTSETIEQDAGARDEVARGHSAGIIIEVHGDPRANPFTGQPLMRLEDPRPALTRPALTRP